MKALRMYSGFQLIRTRSIRFTVIIIHIIKNKSNTVNSTNAYRRKENVKTNY